MMTPHARDAAVLLVLRSGETTIKKMMRQLSNTELTAPQIYASLDRLETRKFVRCKEFGIRTVPDHTWELTVAGRAAAMQVKEAFGR